MAAPNPNKESTPLDRRSLVRAAVLAVLIEKPGHGWDVARRASRRMGPAWRLDAKHIYPYLGRLKSERLVCTKREASGRDPHRPLTVYYPTAKGEEAREVWLAAPLAAGAGGSDLEVRLLFSTTADVPVLLRAVRERREELAEEVEQNAAGHVPAVSYLGRMINLQRSSVDKRLKAEIEWLQEVRAELEELRDRPLPR